MRRLAALAVSLAAALSLCACGPTRQALSSPPPATTQQAPSETQLAMEALLGRYEGTEETAAEAQLLATPVSLPAEELEAVLLHLSALFPEYPFGALTGLEEAYGRYLALAPPQVPEAGGAALSLPVDGGELLAHVKANNDAFLATPSIENSLFRPLDEDYLAWVCQVVAHTLNAELARQDLEGQLPSIRWNLANLKILSGRTFANASYTTGALMQVRPSGADGMVGITGEEMAAHMTVSHEVEHLLQNMAAPAQEALGLSQNYGFCYQWEDLAVNSLYCTWFAEASAERLSAALYNTDPTTYKSMIGYLDSLTLPTLLRGAQPLEVPRLSQQPRLEAVFERFDCQSQAEQQELLRLLYAVELIQVTPDDFWAVYARTYGLDENVQGDEDLIALRRAVKGPVCLTMSKYFYRDLARLLSEEEMALRQVFYLMSMWEFDLSGHLLYDDETRLADTRDFLTAYPEMQSRFLEALAPSAGVTAEELQQAFTAYLCRLPVPRRSLLHGNESWTGGSAIPALSDQAGAFLNSYYETVSQSKTAPVREAARILLGA